MCAIGTPLTVGSPRGHWLKESMSSVPSIALTGRPLYIASSGTWVVEIWHRMTLSSLGLARSSSADRSKDLFTGTNTVNGPGPESNLTISGHPRRTFANSCMSGSYSHVWRIGGSRGAPFTTSTSPICKPRRPRGSHARSTWNGRSPTHVTSMLLSCLMTMSRIVAS